jgi:hypothetical protein
MPLIGIVLATEFFFVLIGFVGVGIFFAKKVWNSEWAETSKENRPELVEYLQSQDSPGKIAILFVVCIIVGLPFLSGSMLVEWEKMSSEDFFDADGATMHGGFTYESVIGPDGPYYWIGYSFLSLIMLIGFGAFVKREVRQGLDLMAANRAQLTVVRNLAFDPDGVIEGRVELPEPVLDAVPTRIEKLMAKLIPRVMGVMICLTLVAFVVEWLNPGSSGYWHVTTERYIDNGGITLGIAYSALTLIVSVACWYLMRTMMITVLGEDESQYPHIFRTEESESEETVDEEDVPIRAQREGPAEMSEVIEVMEAKLAMAIAEAEELREDLVETQEKVETLEREIVSKDIDIVELEEVKDQLKDNIEENIMNQNAGNGKGLAMQDSVMVGDSLFGSTKIDQQIVNDPEAIARAAIEAYRQGKQETGHKQPDNHM